MAKNGSFVIRYNGKKYSTKEFSENEMPLAALRKHIQGKKSGSFTHKGMMVTFELITFAEMVQASKERKMTMVENKEIFKERIYDSEIIGHKLKLFYCKKGNLLKTISLPDNDIDLQVKDILIHDNTFAKIGM